MSDVNEEKGLELACKPFVEQFKAYGLQQGWDEKKVKNIAALIEVSEMAAQKIEASSPRYLELPPVLQVFQNDPAFLRGRPHGRAFYRESQSVVDLEAKKVIRSPLRWDQSEVYDMIDADIRPVDRRRAVYIPLAWRVGYVVGWLSGLAVAQPDEAMNGMAILAALVHPLLSGSLLPSPDCKQLKGGAL